MKVKFLIGALLVFVTFFFLEAVEARGTRSVSRKVATKKTRTKKRKKVVTSLALYARDARGVATLLREQRFSVDLDRLSGGVESLGSISLPQGGGKREIPGEGCFNMLGGGAAEYMQDFERALEGCGGKRIFSGGQGSRIPAFPNPSMEIAKERIPDAGQRGRNWSIVQGISIDDQGNVGSFGCAGAGGFGGCGSVTERDDGQIDVTGGFNGSENHQFTIDTSDSDEEGGTPLYNTPTGAPPEVTPEQLPELPKPEEGSASSDEGSGEGTEPSNQSGSSGAAGDYDDNSDPGTVIANPDPDEGGGNSTCGGPAAFPDPIEYAGQPDPMGGGAAMMVCVDYLTRGTSCRTDQNGTPGPDDESTCEDDAGEPDTGPKFNGPLGVTDPVGP